VELSTPEIANMTAAHILRKDRNHLSHEDNKQAARLFRDAAYYVGNDPMITEAQQALDLIEKAIARLGATIVILDNLHALCRGDNELRDQASASRRIKTIAQRTGTKWVVVCQPRKADSKNKGKTLHISDIKGAGAIIEDADALFTIHRNYVQNPDPNNPPMDTYEPETEIHCLKARTKADGPTFSKLFFHGALATYADITHMEPPPQ
jgi:replicative DNA helicase